MEGIFLSIRAVADGSPVDLKRAEGDAIFKNTLYPTGWRSRDYILSLPECGRADPTSELVVAEKWNCWRTWLHSCAQNSRKQSSVSNDLDRSAS